MVICFYKKWHKFFLSLTTFLLCSMALLGYSSIEVEINDDMASVNQPFKGKIKLIAEEGLEIDEKSFHLGDDPINVKLIGKSRNQSLQIIGNQRTESIQNVTTYEFEIDGQAEGLHMLPQVKVIVGGEKLISENTSYQIRNGKEISGFFIESAIEGPNPIYPGQKAYLVYRIFYQFPVDLVSEHLPLLFPDKGFEAIEEPQFRTYKDRSYQVTEAKVLVVALEPGEFTFSPALIEGYHYSTNFFGRKKYIAPKLRAQGRPYSIVVENFPSENKPNTFTGAVGNYRINSQILGSTDLLVGDKFTLEVSVEGNGDIDSIQAPNLSQSDDINRQFRISGFPEEERGEGYKKFRFSLRPLSTDVVEVPQVSFSSYDPEVDKYFKSETKALPIKVSPVQVSLPKKRKFSSNKLEYIEEKKPIEVLESELDAREESEGPLEKIEISGIKKFDISSYPPINSKYLFLVCFIFWGLIYMASRFLYYGRTVYFRLFRTLSAKQLFNEGARELADISSFTKKLKHAFLLRLFEQGLIPAPNLSVELLSEDGVVGKVRALLLELEALHYGGIREKSIEELKKEAEELFEII